MFLKVIQLANRFCEIGNSKVPLSPSPFAKENPMLFQVPRLPHSTPKAQRRSAFTAVELLVIIAILIIAILVSREVFRPLAVRAAKATSVNFILAQLLANTLPPPSNDPIDADSAVVNTTLTTAATLPDDSTLTDDDRIILWVRHLRQSVSGLAEFVADDEGVISAETILSIASESDIEVDPEDVGNISVDDLRNPFDYDSLRDFTVYKCTENQVHHGQLNALIAQLNGNPWNYLKFLETDAKRESKRFFNANLALELKIAFYLSTNDL